MKIKIARLILFILIIVNCITIFVFSSEMSEKSGNRSRGVTDFIADIIPSIRNMPEEEKIVFKTEVLHPIVRKTAHYTIYMTLGTLAMCLALTYKSTYRQKGISSLLFCILYSISDEIHQSFVPGRYCALRDVFIDSLGALTGIIIIYLITSIYRKIKYKDKPTRKIDESTKIMFISSTGGHFSELMQLRPLIDKCNYHIVTEKTKTNANLKQKYDKKIDFLLYETKKRPFRYAFILFANCFISLYVYLKFRPEVIISTGTHTAGPMCCIGKILGSKIVFIEVMANRTSKTVAGSMIYPFADLFVVQWEEMLKLYPKAKNFGGIY